MKTKKTTAGHAGEITRRDFLNGVSVAIGASLAGASGSSWSLAAGTTAPYPPAQTGMRGSHDGSFEVAHSLVRGQRWKAAPAEETYDLVIVGAGISGLASAYFYHRDVDPQARILIVDNHDDFGGHAKRNEFTLDGRTYIGFGGTMLMESPRGYPPVARRLVAELGIDFDTDGAFLQQEMIDRLGLQASHFLDKENFGADHLLVGDLSRPGALDQSPLSDQGKADVRRLFADEQNYLTDKTPAERKAILESLSWRDYLRTHAHMGEEALAMIQKRPHGVWAIGADALPAWLAWDSGYPGFGGLDLGDDTIAETGAKDDPTRIRFPDGNATIARLLVSRLVPGSTDARSVEDIVAARFAYDALDRPSNPVRIRLASTVVEMTHREGSLANSVDVTYVTAGEAHTVSADKVVWAGYHAMLPHVCPDVPAEQAAALAQSVRAPLVYTNVLLRDWRSLAARGTYRVNCPGSFFQHLRMTHPVSIGDYRYAQSPDEPVILHMQHIPLSPGLAASDQFRAGRRQLLETDFATFEERIRDQLGRLFGPGGLDTDRDIAGITVNRWSHGYAYSTHPESGDVAWYPTRWNDEQPWVRGRASVGNIAIAGSDAASNAMTEAAIEEAHRAVGTFTTRT